MTASQKVNECIDSLFSENANLPVLLSKVLSKAKKEEIPAELISKLTIEAQEIDDGTCPNDWIDINTKLEIWKYFRNLKEHKNDKSVST